MVKGDITMSCLARRAFLAGVAAVALILSGCAADEIEFQGGIFDAVGLGGSNKSLGNEPEMQARAPLVVPPKLDRIPSPGEQPGSEAHGVAALNDPDRQQKLSQEELERQQKEYCQVHYEEKKISGDTTVELVEGPLGPCRKSVLTAIKKINGTQ